MFLGKSRGSVGDVTFSTINGQQIAKARNRNPNNPRTLKQCYQRARFAAAVKFFTRGNQALYKFAFESKRQTESDYNAFMRENVRRSPAISKAAFDNYDYPVCAPFIMSKGSLTPMAVSVADGTFSVSLGVAAPTEAPTTIGDISSLLIQNEQFQAGDIITLVFISSAYDGTYPSVEADGSGATTWTIKQFIIDTASTDTIADITGMSYTTAEGIATLTLASGTAPLAGSLAGMTVVHSRNVAGGLKVSTQELVLNAAASAAYDAILQDGYKQSVAASWRTADSVDIKPEAILQGSIAYGRDNAALTMPFTGSNPIYGAEKAEANLSMNVETDIRSGYITATANAFDEEGAIHDAEQGLLYQYAYNAVTGKFERSGNDSVTVSQLSDGRFSLVSDSDMNAWMYIKSWTNAQGVTYVFQK